MKSALKKTLVFGIISTVMTVNMSIMASAACPLTSLFGGGNILSVLKGNNSSSCPASSIGNILGNSGAGCGTNSNSSCGSKNNILNILMGKTGGCNTNTNCTNGNCDLNANCPNGNCDTNTNCPNGNCDANTSCTDGNCNTATQTEDYAKEVLKYVNEARTANGLSALALDSKLCEAAKARAVETKTKFSHTRPDGTSCFTVLKQFNITYNSCGENIAAGYSSAKAVVNAWLASPGHRANIMNKSFKYMGIGKSGTNWGQLFIG